jgi:hypothetical protein
MGRYAITGKPTVRQRGACLRSDVLRSGGTEEQANADTNYGA